MHKFNPEHLHRLDNEERLELFDPEKTLKQFGLKPGYKVLDVGTGAGFYLPYLSKMVGPEGKVYAIDSQPAAVEYAKNKVEKLCLQNVAVLQSEENKIPLPDQIIDFAYMAFVFHELTNPGEFLSELLRVVKPGGLIGIVEWKKEDRDKGPPKEEVPSEWELGLALEDVGIKVGRMVDLGKYCYGVYAMAPDPELEKKMNNPIKIPPSL